MSVQVGAHFEIGLLCVRVISFTFSFWGVSPGSDCSGGEL